MAPSEVNFIFFLLLQPALWIGGETEALGKKNYFHLNYVIKLPEKCKFVSQHVRAIAKMYFFFQICITARLERHLQKKAWVASFGRPKMTPQSLLASTTGLSPYLRFGCLSTRLFYHELTDLYKKIKKSCPPLSLHGQILWREFFYW